MSNMCDNKTRHIVALPMIEDHGLAGSTDFPSSHPQRAEHVQGTPTQSHMPPSILVYEDYDDPSVHYFPLPSPTQSSYTSILGDI